MIKEGKRFMAYEIIKRLEKEKRNNLLSALQKGVSEIERLKGKHHKVFETSSDIKRCYSNDIILQKLYYMHHNPVSKKWQLADDFVNYIHSSAGYYELNSRPLILLTHYQDVV